MKISVCIPTYNRVKYLSDCALSVIEQIKDNHLADEVEICISDNASTDGTEQMIQRLASSYNNINIRYKRNLENIGPDLNYLSAAALATGSYIWFMGSDDVLKPGALAEVINIVDNTNYEIYLSNRTDCDIDLNPIKVTKWFAGNDYAVYDLCLKAECIDYFNHCRSLGAVFSFLSTIVVSRQHWERVVYDDSFTGTAYSHIYKILSIINYYRSCKIMFIKKSWVLCRGGNDHFVKEGIFKRFMIDINGYLKLAVELFKDEDERRAFLSIMQHEHKLDKLLTIRRILKKQQWEELMVTLKKFHYSSKVMSILRNLGPFGLFVAKCVTVSLRKLNISV